ncbi:hypothetical protein F5B20DRAFT_452637 [Whalleya microplaca]|nr:hypothetical protein F5B20DRAFT_452637 [Whalleya microplaca]
MTPAVLLYSANPRAVLGSFALYCCFMSPLAASVPLCCHCPKISFCFDHAALSGMYVRWNNLPSFTFTYIDLCGKSRCISLGTCIDSMRHLSCSLFPSFTVNVHTMYT